MFQNLYYISGNKVLEFLQLEIKFDFVLMLAHLNKIWDQIVCLFSFAYWRCMAEQRSVMSACLNTNAWQNT